MPELGVVVVALAALLIVLAWESWTVKVLQSLKASSPGLFGPLFDALISADSAIYNRLRQWTDSALWPVTSTLGWVAASLDRLTNHPLAFARNAYAAIQRLFNVEIPYAIRTAAENAGILFREAEAAAQALHDATEQELTALTAELAGFSTRLQDLYQSAVTYALGLFQQAQAYAAGLVQAAEDQAGALVGQEAARASAAEQQVQAEAEAAAQALQASLAGEVARFESELGLVAAGLDSKVAQARSELGAEIVNFEDLVKRRVEAAVEAFPNALLGRISPDAKKSLQADVEAIVTLSLARLRQEIKDVEGLRARYGPAVQAEIEKLRARL